MKKYFYFLMMVVFMGFVSCGSDDDDTGDVGNANVLNGQWVVTDASYGFQAGDVWNFSNGKYTHFSRYYHEKKLGTYTIDSQTQTVILEQNMEFSNYASSLSDEKLSWEIKDGKIYYYDDGKVSSSQEIDDQTYSSLYTHKYTYALSGNILQFITNGGSKSTLTRQ